MDDDVATNATATNNASAVPLIQPAKQVPVVDANNSTCGRPWENFRHPFLFPAAVDYASAAAHGNDDPEGKASSDDTTTVQHPSSLYQLCQYQYATVLLLRCYEPSGAVVDAKNTRVVPASVTAVAVLAMRVMATINIENRSSTRISWKILLLFLYYSTITGPIPSSSSAAAISRGYRAASCVPSVVPPPPAGPFLPRNDSTHHPQRTYGWIQSCVPAAILDCRGNGRGGGHVWRVRLERDQPSSSWQRPRLPRSDAAALYVNSITALGSAHCLPGRSDDIMDSAGGNDKFRENARGMNRRCSG